VADPPVLPPGEIVPRQPACVVDDFYLMRGIGRPLPKHDVDIEDGGAGGETRHQDTGVPGGDQAVGGFPTRRIRSPIGEVLPSAAEIREIDTEGGASS